MITLDKLLETYNISDEMFRAADISWEDLLLIYKDFADKKNDYENIMKHFIEEYISDIDKSHIHSYRHRIKSPEHLLAKIIKKRSGNNEKYKNITIDNYTQFLTDLIGIRVFVLFKMQWNEFHQYILSQFENEERYYIKDSIRDFDSNPKHHYVAEAPKVHIRLGDDKTIYRSYLKDDHIISGKIYRSVHYIIKYMGVYIEIQLRTLFEEGWGEIDHAIVYPYNEDNELFKNFSELINRCAGMADEMGSFFHLMKMNIPQEMIEKLKNVTSYEGEANESFKTNHDKNSTLINETPQDILNLIMQE